MSISWSQGLKKLGLWNIWMMDIFGFQDDFSFLIYFLFNLALWLFAGLFYSLFRCGCCGCWGLPACPIEHWGFSYYGGVRGKQFLVTLHTSFWRGMCCFLSSVAFLLLGLLLTCVFFFSYGVQRKRVTLLMAASLFQGASIGPLIDLAIHIDPRYGFVVVNGLCEDSCNVFNVLVSLEALIGVKSNY